MKDLPSQEYLKSIINYDELTGNFKWIDRRGGSKSKIKAGSIHKRDQYLRIKIKRVCYQGHRLAWLYVYGYIDNTLQIDHINGIRSDNRICNLRLVPRSENQKNLKLSKSNKTGFNGVSFSKFENKYVASISVNGKRERLGSTHVFEDAVKMRQEANIKYGYHENHGKKV